VGMETNVYSNREYTFLTLAEFQNESITSVPAQGRGSSFNIII
jgi:hypothetical protein